MTDSRCDGWPASCGATTLLTVLMVTWTTLFTPAHGDDAPHVSDVVAGITYCKGFGDQVETVEMRQPVHLAEIVGLIHEGQAQCAAGHIKSGMHLLRMALSQLSGG